MKCSVIVACYNPILSKVKFTLKTILQQDIKDIEIILVDDGSKDNQFQAVEQYLVQNNFKNYKFVANKINQGTVKNIISGLNVCTGRYIKLLSPGDGFYSSDVVSYLCNYMDQNQVLACFGRMMGYSNSEGNIKFQEFEHPYDIVSYIKKNCTDVLKKNLVLFCDHVPGATFFIERDFCKKCFQQIDTNVKFVEDILEVYAMYEGHPFKFVDKFVVYYENDTGISTSKVSPVKIRMKKDAEEFYANSMKAYHSDKYIEKRVKNAGKYSYTNYRKQIVSIILNNSDSLAFLYRVLSGKLWRKKHKCVDQGFLADLSFLD